jgi:surfeit locus 1 family protein
MAALHFEAEWRTTLLVVIMVPVLAGLGFWQLSRAEEKTAISQEFERKRVQPSVPLGQLVDRPAQELAYRPVRLTGRFRQQEYFLQDNRMVQGRYGNEVLGVFEVDDSDLLVLVNRGWVVADPSRRSMPDVPLLSGDVAISGQVYVAPGRPYMLADEPLEEGWPKRVQAVEIDKMAAALGVQSETLFRYPVRINVDEKGALYVDWPVINVSPAKHYGYAFQWFSMSAVLALLFLLRSTNLLALVRGTRD